MVEIVTSGGGGDVAGRPGGGGGGAIAGVVYLTHVDQYETNMKERGL